jgi:hypothetical protein
MALIVSDGTGLANADSYQTLVDARASADLLGLALPVVDADADIALRNGARYVDRYESRFAGTRLVDTQALSFPRLDSYKCYGNNTIDIASDSIPNEIKLAQMFAAVEYGKGTDVMPVNDGKSIASNEVVGAVKQSYFDNGKTGKSIVITKSVDALSPLLCVGGGFTVRTKRV